jgi:hypothetical protein
MISSKAVQYDPREKILAFLNWLGPRVRMSPHDVLTKYSTKTLEGFYKQAVEFNLRRDLAAAMVAAPLEYHKHIAELYNYDESQYVSAKESIEGEPERDPLRVLEVSVGGVDRGVR